MTTITMNCKNIEWVQVDRGEIAVCFRKADGELDMVCLYEWECLHFTAGENLQGLVEEIEDRAEQLLPEEDRLYLEDKLWSTLMAWSAEDDEDDC